MSHSLIPYIASNFGDKTFVVEPSFEGKIFVV